MYIRPYSKIINTVTVHFQQLFTPKTRGRQIEVMKELMIAREVIISLPLQGSTQISRLEAWGSQQSSLSEARRLRAGLAAAGVGPERRGP